MELTDYWTDPCSLLSIPWWKHRNITLPHHIKILHHRDFSPEAARGYRDSVYFRLLHDLRAIPEADCAGYLVRSISPRDGGLIASIINRSYPDIRVTRDQILAMEKSSAYCPSLWIGIWDSLDQSPLGCAIGEYDPESGEMSIEWVQVLPPFRRRGLGKLLVCQLLRRTPEGARFATVSGQAENESNPEALYRSCGFSGSDYWHILTKEN